MTDEYVPSSENSNSLPYRSSLEDEIIFKIGSKLEDPSLLSSSPRHLKSEDKQ